MMDFLLASEYRLKICIFARTGPENTLIVITICTWHLAVEWLESRLKSNL